MSAQNFGTASQYLDGTIAGNEFIDKSGNGYNVNIINNDIETGHGFPYKSQALIAQKASNFGLIPNPNNFWFTAAGVPNQIPVISLFQNIDYGNQIFTRHSVQVLDSVQQEIYEPRISEIVTYASVLTGTNLISANSYFGVPTEVTSNVKWVDSVNGNDTTGNGTKALPWKTLTKANTGTSNQTIYVKTGVYNDTATIFFAGGQTWMFIGYCPCSNSSSIAFSTSASNGNYFQGAIVTPASAGRAIYLISGNNNIINRCWINANGSFSKNFQVLDGTGNAITNCILDNSINNPHIDIRKVACDINGCLFIGIKATAADVVSFNTTAITGTQNIIYNKFKTTLSTNRYLFLFNTAGNYNIKFNRIQTDGGYGIQGLLAGSSMVGNINYSYNYIVPTNLTSHVILSSDPNNIINYTILYNYIKLVNGTLVNGVIGLVGQPPPIINHNYIDVYMYTGCITVSATSIKGPCDISYNTVLTRADGSHIVLGNDASTAYDNAYDGSTIIGNKMYGVWYFNPDSITNISHGIAIYNSINCKVKYNYSNGANHIIVIKAGDRPTAMVNTDCIVSYNIGINNEGSLFPKTMSGIKFYNNTTYADNPNIQQIAGGMFVLSHPGPAINNVFKNNIFIDKTPANPEISIIRMDDTNALTGFVSDNNIIYSENNMVANLSVGTFYTFPQWQALGYDTNSIFSDVLFRSLLEEKIWPLEPIFNTSDLPIGNDLGLDVSTSWNKSREVTPTIVTRTQTIPYQNGAYIQ